MAVYVVQHVSFEGPGQIQPILEGMGRTVRTVHVWRGDPLPLPDHVTLLVSMGGPMSVHDSHSFRWLEEERKLIADLYRRGTPVLGICLGAQQIAAALGGDVVPSPQREIGWFPVGPPSGRVTAMDVPEAQTMTVLHWHGEMVNVDGIPGAQVTLSSAGCPVQAFRCGPGVLGLQFHLEMDEAAVAGIIACSHEELMQNADQQFVQSEREIAAGVKKWSPPAHRVLARVLTELTSS